MQPDVQAARDLIPTEDGVEAISVGKDIYDPLLFSPTVIKFTAKQYVFLRSYRLGVPLEEAAAKAHMTKDEAERFLDKPRVREWLQDRAVKDYVKMEWEEPGKWWKMGNDILEGKGQWSKVELEIWKEFGERIVPISRYPQSQQPPRIEINIDPTAVQEAFRRQNAIEADLSQNP